MTRRWMILTVLLMVALPSAVCASWIKDKVYLQTDSVGKVEFSHFSHLAEKSIGKNCPVCHNDVFHIVTKKNPAFTMAQMEAGKACGFCHNGKKAFNVNGDCLTCHAGDVEINYGETGKVLFSHEVHTGMFPCDECHADLFKAERNSNKVGMQKMEEGASCGACHDGSSAFSVKGDCGKCHQGAENIAIQSPVGEIVFSHDFHTGMFGCDDCHPGTFKAKANSNKVGMKKMAAGESCGACHDGDTAFATTGDCAKCHTGAKELLIQTKSVGSVAFSHSLHTGMFGCGECHPDTFKAKAGSNQVGMKQMEKGESCGACHDGDTAFGVKDSCVKCHAGDIQYVNADAGNITFPHQAHIDMFGCDECHPDQFKARRGVNKSTMEAMEQGESCGACHDGSTAFGVAEDCESCHAM